MTPDGPDQGNYGWFQYGGRDVHRPRVDHGVQLPLHRRPEDPALVLWQRDDDSWVVDDDDRDTYFHIHGFTRDQVIAAIRFAWAMGWIDHQRTRRALIRVVDRADEQLSFS